MNETAEHYFTGFWVNDLEEGREHGWRSVGLMFLDDCLVVRLDLGKYEDGSPGTMYRTFSYSIEDDFLLIQRVREDKFRGGYWELGDDDGLRLEFGGQWVTFRETDVEGLVARGFDRTVLEHLMKTARRMNMPFYENFDLSKLLHGKRPPDEWI